jgi:hypothetical protein
MRVDDPTSGSHPAAGNEHTLTPGSRGLNRPGFSGGSIT